jgi:CO/xanthine dehydrogenase FAD-binding subunit
MPDLQYERPQSLSRAVELLHDASGPVAILAGGTDLLVKIRAGMFSSGLVLDIKQIPEANGIRWGGDGELRLGAAVTMWDVYHDARLCETYPAVADGARAVGSLQIRHRATVVGNLCNASPCMDTAPGLLLLDARLRLVSAKGERELPLRELFVDVKKTSLAPGELAVEVMVPASSTRQRTAFDKIKRVRGHDLALVNAAAAFDPEDRTVRAVIGSCGRTPLRTPRVAAGEGERGMTEAAAQLAAAAVAAISPIDDVRASAEYRRDMAALLCRRLVRVLFGRQGGLSR